MPTLWNGPLGSARTRQIGLTMSQSPDPKVSATVEQMTADLRIASTESPGVPRELAEAAVRAGLQHTTGTIGFAGQYASGDYTVLFLLDSGGGYSSLWPQWAFALAKDAMLGNKKVWVGSYGDPVGTNLHFVMVLA
ncbi:MAG: hypothetical protein JWO49_133 [Arthrobacter sp.]|nr:hypothetical protein [Arthrobacter sp.]